MNDIQCADQGPPRCTNLVEGKGLYCPTHLPGPGNLNKYANDIVQTAPLRRSPLLQIVVLALLLLLLGVSGFSGVIMKLVKMLTG
jgi:hypothetical protein